ncbi:MAG: diguanylate cyclase [Naasia sp.]|jgi:predicted dinucleotide-binding enzyme|uniref:NADPH-dependent F420 reductase n=1 Tax=Naasia sp. TaxID=2546198 RepID=UPI0026150CC3|nr:NAD(P)-binding domain-containing protein [Naasia sp.]MCU1570191.1 diguanylate cyclase [Naasia sp.]
MATITIFGTGNMGSAIGAVFAAGGHSVQHIDTATQEPAITGDIVVLAVPYGALATIAARFPAELTGRIVVDITNPVDFATFDGLTVAPDSSAAAELAAALPGASVLKAFNTNFAATLASGKVGENRTTVLIAGDDAEAKQTLAQAIAAGGAVDALDAGSLKRARELEALGFAQLVLAATEKVSWTSGFAVIR